MGKIYKNGILFAGSTENARSVAFDNADTDLESTNVQEAIEEIKSDVAEINSNISGKLGKVIFSTDNIAKQIGKSGLPYTCESDYLMVVSRFECASSGQEVHIQINNINMVSSNSSTVTYGFVLPVSKGDIVSANNIDYISSRTRFSFWKTK